MSFPSSSANPQHSLQGINTDINQTSISIGSNDYTAALDSIRQNLSRVQSVLDAGQTTDDIAEKASSRLAFIEQSLIQAIDAEEKKGGLKKKRSFKNMVTDLVKSITSTRKELLGVDPKTAAKLGERVVSRFERESEEALGSKPPATMHQTKLGEQSQNFPPQSRSSHLGVQSIAPPSQHNLLSRSTTSLNTMHGLPSRSIGGSSGQYSSSSYTRQQFDSTSGFMPTPSRHGSQKYHGSQQEGFKHKGRQQFMPHRDAHARVERFDDSYPVQYQRFTQPETPHQPSRVTASPRHTQQTSSGRSFEPAPPSAVQGGGNRGYYTSHRAQEIAHAGRCSSNSGSLSSTRNSNHPPPPSVRSSSDSSTTSLTMVFAHGGDVESFDSHQVERRPESIVPPHQPAQLGQRIQDRSLMPAAALQKQTPLQTNPPVQYSPREWQSVTNFGPTGGRPTGTDPQSFRRSFEIPLENRSLMRIEHESITAPQSFTGYPWHRDYTETNDDHSVFSQTSDYDHYDYGNQSPRSSIQTGGSGDTFGQKHRGGQDSS